MSYTPMLIINYQHLEKHRDHIIASAEAGLRASIKLQDQRNAYRELMVALNTSVVIFPENSDRNRPLMLCVIHPELTRHNKRVRDLLDMLEIEYKTLD